MITKAHTVVVDVDSIYIAEWSPDEVPGRSPPTQVHLLFSVPSLTPIPVVVRFKSPATLDRIIAALQDIGAACGGTREGARP
jgi:hypothetical protein